jgi:hypothetical protein
MQDVNPVVVCGFLNFHFSFTLWGNGKHEWTYRSDVGQSVTILDKEWRFHRPVINILSKRSNGVGISPLTSPVTEASSS